jgi:hypothetical protein
LSTRGDAHVTRIANAGGHPARRGAPIAAILIPAAFFLSVASPAAREPNGFMGLGYVGALFLAGAVLSLGVGLIRAARRKGSQPSHRGSASPANVPDGA